MIRIQNIARTGRNIECRKVIVKLGSNVVLTPHGGIDLPTLEGLADSVADLRERGVEIILVTSGAIGLACSQLRKPRPRIIPEKQAFAAIGQISLMHVYQEIFAARGLTAAQLLLTRADMEDRRGYLNARHALDHLLKLGAIPIINENDTISTDELSFGDNDVLSAYVAIKMKADLFVILSSVAGVMKSPPRTGSKKSKGAEEIIPVIEKIDSTAFASVDDSRSGHGMGGMKSKLQAAKTACDAGVHTIIAGGKTAGILNQIFGGKFSGTYLPASREGAKISSHERWIGYGRSTKGNRLTLDHGAVDALLRKKTSLLPVGVTEVTGVFKPGDIVDICNPEGSSIARGLVNYSSEEIEKIKGHKTKEIEFILGYHNYDEVVHRDNLVIL